LLAVDLGFNSAN